MMKTQDYSYFIERYLSGEMEDAERRWFTREMQDNEELRKEVALRKKTEQVLERRSSLQLRSRLDKLETMRKEKKREAAIHRMELMKYAAVFAGVAVITGLIIFNGKTFTSEEIVERYYRSYDAPAAHRSSSSTNSDYLLGLKYYNEKDYKSAASQFAKVLEVYPGDMQTHLLSGVSNMEVKKYNDAKKSFTTVIDNNNNLFIESAKWYLALCYIKTEENTKASDLLESIRNEGGIYSKDARKVLRKIK